MRIRVATPGDVPAALEVQRRARSSAAMPPAPHGAADRLLAGVRQGQVRVAGLPGAAVAGYARLDGPWLGDLYVDPAHQGQGVGSALLALARALHPGLGLRVLAGNRSARSFYARAGLREVARWPDGDDGLPEVEMRCDAAAGSPPPSAP